MDDVTQSHEQVPLMEGGLESVKATAAQLKAAGIAHDIEMTGGAPGPESAVTCSRSRAKI